MSLVFQLSAQQVNTESSTTEVTSSVNSQEEPHLEGLSLFVSLQDLDFSEEGISIHVGGHSYAVHSLKKQENQWIAEVANEPKCAWGHPLCVGEHGCGQCHTRICPLYQQRTSYCR
ncbi:MAG: hypothetical protein WA347_03605 [Rhabdochlamydiaceae bacterium]